MLLCQTEVVVPMDFENISVEMCQTEGGRKDDGERVNVG